MTGCRPGVSVILPVFNGEAFLAEALDSILCQDRTDIELVVIDDGSTDILQRYTGAMTYRHQENRGPAAARNLGLELARGNLIAFIDADDTWPAGKLRHQLALLAGAAAHHCEFVMGHSRFVQHRDGGDGQPEVLIEACPQMLLGAGLYTRRVFDRVGVFDESLRHGEDWDWFTRARELSVPMYMSAEVTLTYRRHGNNMSRDLAASQGDFLKLLRNSLQRRREAGDGRAAELAAWPMAAGTPGGEP